MRQQGGTGDEPFSAAGSPTPLCPLCVTAHGPHTHPPRGSHPRLHARFAASGRGRSRMNQCCDSREVLVTNPSPPPGAQRPRVLCVSRRTGHTHTPPEGFTPQAPCTVCCLRATPTWSQPDEPVLRHGQEVKKGNTAGKGMSVLTYGVCTWVGGWVGGMGCKDCLSRATERPATTMRGKPGAGRIVRHPPPTPLASRSKPDAGITNCLPV